MLAIDPTTKWKPGRDKLNETEYGSCQMQDMIGIKDKKVAEEAAERERIEGNKRARIEKQQLEADGLLELQASYDRCHPECTCGVTPCPVAGLKKCENCGDIKKTVCRKQPCRAARIEAPTLMAIEGPCDTLPVVLEVQDEQIDHLSAE